ncbi:hypothetical protein RE6C_05729 [Rhodopirellula europaea 6C]|uniref:Uncharacterized protein n=1 Tax=Rhodopirellula europaea 6C TaxID=1263867 RepID=M2A3D3_9BACT|nr:hypothetical protein RE6C_05729 [Rhodopirellula europaea 6C]
MRFVRSSETFEAICSSDRRTPSLSDFAATSDHAENRDQFVCVMG